MARTTQFRVTIQFGDCDPAGIVFYPNFQRWMDAASLSFFMQCGVPPWRELVKTRGIVGTPLGDHHQASSPPPPARGLGSTRRNGGRVFIQRHRVMRGAT
jgi:4-hydroxybenzoyl-CoA thioesterase